MSENRKGTTAVPWDKKNLSSTSNWEKARRAHKVRIVKGKFLCFVTGAGNGLGRAIAGMAFQDQGILPNAMSGSRVILVDKDEEALKETSGKKMRQFLKHRKIEVELEVVDLADLNATQKLVERVEEKQDKDFEHVIFVNNASSLADPSKQLSQFDDVNDLGEYWNVNITSRMFMSTQIGRIFSSSKRTIVHTARYESNSPTPYLGPSCMAASAIETFAKTYAKENPNIRVLHFCSGALDTKRTHRLIESCCNKQLQDNLKEIAEANRLTVPLEAAKRMIKYIEGNEFVTGEVLYVHDENDKDKKKESTNDDEQKIALNNKLGTSVTEQKKLETTSTNLKKTDNKELVITAGDQRKPLTDVEEQKKPPTNEKNPPITITDQNKPTTSVSDQTKPTTTVTDDHKKPAKTVIDQKKLETTVTDHKKPAKTVIDQKKLETTVTDHKKPAKTVIDQKKLETTVTDHKKPAKTVIDQKKLETTVTDHKKPAKTVIDRKKQETTVTDLKKMPTTDTDQKKSVTTVFEQKNPQTTVSDQKKPPTIVTKQKKPVTAVSDEKKPTKVVVDTKKANQEKTINENERSKINGQKENQINKEKTINDQKRLLTTASDQKKEEKFNSQKKEIAISFNHKKVEATINNQGKVSPNVSEQKKQIAVVVNQNETQENMVNLKNKEEPPSEIHEIHIEQKKPNKPDQTKPKTFNSKKNEVKLVIDQKNVKTTSLKTNDGNPKKPNEEQLKQIQTTNGKQKPATMNDQRKAETVVSVSNKKGPSVVKISVNGSA